MSASRAIRLADRQIGVDHPPFIVAEMSGNHGQSLDRALSIVDAAAEAGVDALKLQTYTADTMTLDIKDGAFRIDDPNSLWDGRTLYDLYAEAHTPWEWHALIMKRCQERGILCFSTPFDSTAVEFLEELSVPAYKVASFENTDLPLLRLVAATSKPVLLSTGMATLSELDESMKVLQESGCGEIILLKCTSAYPAPPQAANLRAIPMLRQRYGVQVGLSDHTSGIGDGVASVAVGATVIEKHFTLRRADGGVDAEFSMEPEEMAALARGSRVAWQAMGKALLDCGEAERASLMFRRSLYITQDVKAGEVLTTRNVRAIRPGHGLAPTNMDKVLERTVVRDAPRGTPVSWELLGVSDPDPAGEG